MPLALRRVHLANPHTASIALGVAMALSAALILWAGRGTTFFNDEVYYYARQVEIGGHAQPFGFEYLFAPYNSHLPVVGRLVYELLFATVGAEYLVFRVAAVAAYLLCVGLFFALARPRVGPLAALAAAVVLLFMGAAWEAMLWPFDLHTLIALATGLGALLALERGGPRADLACCALLVLATATLELGLSFVAGVAVSILLRPDRRARLWIVAIPAVGYMIWAVWASRYGQSIVEPSNLANLATSLPASLAATATSLTGAIDLGGVDSSLRTGVSGVGVVLAVLLAVAFARRISRHPVSPSSWVLLTILGSYWAFIALADRPPETSRYLLVDAILVLLIVADLTPVERVRRIPAAFLAAILAIALPLNIATLFEGRGLLLEQAQATGAEYAMLELARERVAPAYVPAGDSGAVEFGPVPAIGLSAGDYFAAADRVGSLGVPLTELRAGSERVRRGADAVLVGALALRARPAPAPSDPGGCSTSAASAATPGVAALPAGGALLQAGGEADVSLEVARFGGEPPGVALGELATGAWVVLSIPADEAPDPWRIYFDGPLRVCPLNAPGSG